MSDAGDPGLTLERLASAFECAEVYSKIGWSRRFDLEDGIEGTVSSREQGWSLRAGDGRSSCFLASAGAPSPSCELPSPAPGGLRLPPDLGGAEWEDDGAAEAPLMGELEGRRLLQAISSTLEAEAPRARLRRLILEDGVSDVQIVNTNGVEASFRNRIATLRMQAVEPETGEPAEIYVAGRRADGFRARAVASRMVDLLFISREGRSVDEAAVTTLLSPELTTAILDSMSALFVDSERAPDWLRPGNQVATELVTLIDDGRCPLGLVRAPVDGEGVPTGPLALIEKGRAGERIVPWWIARETGSSPIRGCRLRAGWRDLPRTGPTHLYLEPDREVSVSALLSAVEQGYYLIEALGPCSVDPAGERFSVRCCGFEVEKGRPAGPVSCVQLQGRLQQLLGGVRGVARDLTFLPRSGMVGSPSVLVEGLDLRGDSS